MTLYTASFETVILRFALMMATVLVAFLINLPFLALLALPIFLSAMMAISFFPKTSNVKILAITNNGESNIAA